MAGRSLSGPSEFDLIARIRDRAGRHGRDDVVLGIGDDAALLQPPAGMQLVVATDMLNAGVHFPHDTAPADIGWKALAVNLSDLAAMGAEPAWCTLALSLPKPDSAWLDLFLDGFFELAKVHRVALVGGDTTRAALSICIAVHGCVPAGRALRRSGAQPGDDVWVSGSLGDAAGALRQWHAGGRIEPQLHTRLDRPLPRIGLGLALRGVASGCIDLSDGLLADLGHLCVASGVAAQLDLAALPASAALRSAFDGEALLELQACGGDDYELCFSAPETARAAVEQIARSTGVPIVRIGRIVAGQGVRALRADGAMWKPSSAGFRHFA